MKRQFSASQFAGANTLRDQLIHFENNQNFDLQEVKNEDKLSNEVMEDEKEDQLKIKAKKKFKVLNKNSTARILLSRAKVSKMQSKFPHSLNPVVPDIPETSK